MDQFSPAIFFDVLAQAQKAYTKQLDPVCKEWGLTRNELDVLLFLYNNPESDRAADIVSRRGMAKSHVSLSVRTLEEKGMLERQFLETDRRTAHLKIIGQGLVIAAAAREKQREYFGQMYTGVTEEEMVIWKKITRVVRENIENINKT